VIVCAQQRRKRTTPTFDPARPSTDAELLSLPFRNQFNSLNNSDGTLTGVFTDGGTAGPCALPAGPAGPQGAPREVSAADLTFAIGGATANSNTVQPLAEDAGQTAIIAKMNELIQALRR
jgi:hypothetical protein